MVFPRMSLGCVVVGFPAVLIFLMTWPFFESRVFLRFDLHQTAGDADRISIADLDGDGDLDAWTNRRANGPPQVWRNVGKGSFELGQQPTLNDDYEVLLYADNEAALGDVDGDNDIDVLSCTGLLWLNEGDGTFVDSGRNFRLTEESQRIRDVTWKRWQGQLGDLDGDGDLDIVTLAGVVWRNKGDGVFQTDASYVGGVSRMQSLRPMRLGIALEDLDGDSDLDVFVLGSQKAASIWFNDGTGVFVERELVAAARGGLQSCFALGDLDLDGDIDAWVDRKIWFNDGSGNFTESGQSFEAGITWWSRMARIVDFSEVALGSGSSPLRGIALGDADGDGDLDAFTSSQNRQFPHKLWENDGNGYFTQTSQELGSGRRPGSSVVFRDLDGNGELDVWVAGRPSQIWLKY